MLEQWLGAITVHSDHVGLCSRETITFRLPNFQKLNLSYLRCHVISFSWHLDGRVMHLPPASRESEFIIEVPFHAQT